MIEVEYIHFKVTVFLPSPKLDIEWLSYVEDHFVL